MRIHSVMLATALLVGALCAGPSLAHAESVYVKYRGEVNLKPFECKDIARSSFIRRVCYDAANEYMLINLNGTYYHYCAIDEGTVSTFLAADSMGRFYNASIKGQFDCRENGAPEYSSVCLLGPHDAEQSPVKEQIVMEQPPVKAQRVMEEAPAKVQAVVEALPANVQPSLEQPPARVGPFMEQFITGAFPSPSDQCLTTQNTKSVLRD